VFPSLYTHRHKGKGCFLRRHASRLALLCCDEGGDSKTFRKKILETGPNTEFISVSAQSSLMPELILKYGPGLVQGFQVDHDFYSDKWQHLGECSVMH
jgi:hypothetical protein